MQDSPRLQQDRLNPARHDHREAHGQYEPYSQVCQDGFDDLLILDEADDSDASPALRTGEGIDLEIKVFWGSLEVPALGVGAG